VEQIILVVHLLVSLAIIGLIMMQRGKGSDIGASFGAGASQTLFGSAGSANALTKATAWLVVAFFATSFGLAVIADSRTADDDDLGFELPIEEMLPVPANEPLNESELPMVEEQGEAMESISDLPVLESEGESAVDSAGELPEG
jgi:preprotein translocase subunit SecG